MATLRPHNAAAAALVTPSNQSRPRRQRGANKKAGFLRRLLHAPSPSSSASASASTASHRRANQSNAAVLTSAATMSPATSFYSLRPASRALRSGRRFLGSAMILATEKPPENLVQWLERECPQDLVPKVLAYAGPQMTAVLSRTNKFWHDLIDRESTWRTLCEELYKWKEGDECPASWKEFYRYNPCVPVDYPDVAAAFALVKSARMEQVRSIRVLLRPGRYILRDAIHIQAPSAVHVEVETMEMPESFHPAVEAPAETTTEPARRRKSSKSLRNILACRNIEVEEPEEEPAPEFVEPMSSILPSAKRAKLVLRTRRHNEPIVRVRQGMCTLRNLELCHISHGIDIWNGNAAVQIQPPVGPDDQPMLVVPAPTAILERVEITSASGRGIVNIDGGRVTIKNCYVHDCAATGIYVGGPGSRAQIERTDVVRNGNGNTQHRRGIARGHSGIYLEQGHAQINDCNISLNSLTGISAVSPENAILDLERSDLVSNGSVQLEMPHAGTPAHTRSSTTDNNLSPTGNPRSRSGLVGEDGGN